MFGWKPIPEMPNQDVCLCGILIDVAWPVGEHT